MSPVAQQTLTYAQNLFEVVAIVAFALSGLLEAARRRLDAVGFFVAAGLTAFGGGTLRDVLLDRRPFFWVANPQWVWALFALCVAALAFMRANHVAPTERAMQWPDALGLGLFAASGTQIALQADVPAVVAVLMGTTTAVVGGVLRDIVVNEVPRAFSDHRPYAVCAFVGGWVMVGATAAHWPYEWALAASAGVTMALRAVALWTGWTLPAWNPGADDPPDEPNR